MPHCRRRTSARNNPSRWNWWASKVSTTLHFSSLYRTGMSTAEVQCVSKRGNKHGQLPTTNLNQKIITSTKKTVKCMKNQGNGACRSLSHWEHRNDWRPEPARLAADVVESSFAAVSFATTSPSPPLSSLLDSSFPGGLSLPWCKKITDQALRRYKRDRRPWRLGPDTSPCVAVRSEPLALRDQLTLLCF